MDKAQRILLIVFLAGMFAIGDRTFKDFDLRLGLIFAITLVAAIMFMKEPTK